MHVSENLTLLWILNEFKNSRTKNRAGASSSLSAKQREIDNLLTNEINLEAVKIKLQEITSLFHKFAGALHAHMRLLFR